MTGKHWKRASTSILNTGHTNDTISHWGDTNPIIKGAGIGYPWIGYGNKDIPNRFGLINNELPSNIRPLIEVPFNLPADKARFAELMREYVDVQEVLPSFFDQDIKIIQILRLNKTKHPYVKSMSMESLVDLDNNYSLIAGGGFVAFDIKVKKGDATKWITVIIKGFKPDYGGN